MLRVFSLIFVFCAFVARASSLWAQGSPRFVDVTETSGVAISQQLGTGAAWGDYDGDGDPDLYVTNWGSAVTITRNALFRNNGDGTFTDVARQAGVAREGFNSIMATWSDYDNDGDLDLYVVDFFRSNALYRNSGNGSFQDVTGSAGVAGGGLGNNLSASWGDYNGDGDPDLYLSKSRVGNELYRNLGNGSFVEVDAGVDDKRDSQHGAWIDYDGDGDLDLYVVNREQASALFRNDGVGSFQDVAALLGVDNTDVGRSSAWADFDNDGDPDCFVANVGANALYRNQGDGTFVNVSKQAGVRKVVSGWVSWTGTWGDFNHDGLLDLFVAHGAESENGEPDVVFVGEAGGRFADRSAGSGLETAGYSMGAAAADYDGDGDLDLFVVHDRFPGFEMSRLFRNEQNGVNFIKVKVAGAGPPLSRRDGAGAKVRLLAAGSQTLRGFRVVGSGPPSEVHFGVAPGNYDVEVTFPSGRIVKQGGVVSGQTVAVKEQ